jgi:hypothetical protein
VLIDESGRPVGEVFDRGLPVDPLDLLLHNPLHVGSVLLRREWQERVGLFDEGLRSYEDWDMWLRLAVAGCRMCSIAQPVSLYRFHSAQMTRIGKQMTASTFAVLEKLYADPSLPAPWQVRKAEAYGRAFLRAAAQAYTVRDFPLAREHMRAAVEHSPSLGEENAEALANMVAGWANHTKTKEPLEFLEGVYAHLPDELATLRRRRRQDLAREAMQLSHVASQAGDEKGARRRLWQAIGYDPRVLVNRGVLAMVARWGLTPRTVTPPEGVSAAITQAEGRPLRRV